MNRTLTNAIRFIIDECLPPLIRDNYYFMYPFFFIWFKGKNLHTAMHFKKIAPTLSEEEYIRIYQTMGTLARDRVTDLTQSAIHHMKQHIISGAKSLLDVGCGNGYWLSQAHEIVPEVAGCDLKQALRYIDCPFHYGNIEQLPFADNAFDVVTCHHTIEHIADYRKAISELKRVAAKQLIIVVPRQRYYYYTLDLHLHFFHYKEQLVEAIGLKNYTCESQLGDWIYFGYKT